MRKSLAVLALALGAITVTPAAAFADPVAPAYAAPVIAPGSVSSGTVTSGGTVEFCGAGFAPGSPVVIAVGGDVIGTVTAGADGAFCVDIVLTGSGPQVLSASGTAPDGRGRVVTATVTITSTAAAPVRSGGSISVGATSGSTAKATTRSTARSGSNVSKLPRTGADGTATQVWAGVGLLGLGGGLVALTVARRRETPDAA
jgi:LPXTG-motif cell wall-anchored protein